MRLRVFHAIREDVFVIWLELRLRVLFPRCFVYTVWFSLLSTDAFEQDVSPTKRVPKRGEQGKADLKTRKTARFSKNNFPDVEEPSPLSLSRSAYRKTPFKENGTTTTPRFSENQIEPPFTETPDSDAQPIPKKVVWSKTPPSKLEALIAVMRFEAKYKRVCEKALYTKSGNKVIFLNWEKKEFVASARAIKNFKGALFRYKKSLAALKSICKMAVAKHDKAEKIRIQEEKKASKPKREVKVTPKMAEFQNKLPKPMILTELRMYLSNTIAPLGREETDPDPFKAWNDLT